MFTSKEKTWEMAEEIRQEVNLPVIAVGRINEHGDIDKVKEEDMADFIAIGRPLISDPNYIFKYFGDDNSYRPCLSCLDGCLGGVKSGEGLQCVMNPEIGNNKQFKTGKTNRSFVVVGGGLSGMTAALYLDDKGNDVTLYEKDELGGIFRYAPLPPGKEPLQKALDYYEKELGRRDIEVIFEEADASDLNEFDEAIIATGSKSLIPPIDGLEEYEWADILLPENMPENKKAMVIGGGLIGVETAYALSENDNRVILVELLPELAGNMFKLEKAQLLKKLENRDNVSIYTETDIKEVDGDTVKAEKDGEDITWKGINKIVMVTGMQSYNPFEDQEENIEIPLYVVGDAEEPGKAEDVIKSAYETVAEL